MIDQTLTAEQLAIEKQLPVDLVKAFVRLSHATGSAGAIETHFAIIEETLIDKAIRMIEAADELAARCKHQNLTKMCREALNNYLGTRE